MSNVDIMTKVQEVKALVGDITARYSLQAPTNVKPFASRKDLEQTLRPDMCRLINELQFAWEMNMKLYQQLAKDQAKLKELDAPKVVVASSAELKQIEKQVTLREVIR